MCSVETSFVKHLSNSVTQFCIVLHDREFCLNYTIFNIIIGIKDGGLADIHEDVGDIIELRNKSRKDRREI